MRNSAKSRGLPPSPDASVPWARDAPRQHHKTEVTGNRNREQHEHPVSPAFAITADVRGEIFHGRYWPAKLGIVCTDAGRSVGPRTHRVARVGRGSVRTVTKRDPDVACPGTGRCQPRGAGGAYCSSVRGGRDQHDRSRLHYRGRAPSGSPCDTALAGMVELQHSGRAIIRHMIEPASRKSDFKTGNQNGDDGQLACVRYGPADAALYLRLRAQRAGET